MANNTILLVEDDPDIVELVRYNLGRDGFVLLEAGDGEAGLRIAVSGDPVLILLDLMLPGIGGLEVCRRLKEQESTRAIPVIMLTAKGEESDIVLGLGLGADDYVTKPFSPRQLIARIGAVLRRGRGAHTQPPGERVEHGPFWIDATRHEIRLEGTPMTLTLAEFRLLQALVGHPDRVFTRDQLIDRITQGKSVIIDRNVDVHVRSIRKKLGRHGDLIVTVRGVGYKCQG